MLLVARFEVSVGSAVGNGDDGQEFAVAAQGEVPCLLFVTLWGYCHRPNVHDGANRGSFAHEGTWCLRHLLDVQWILIQS